MASLFHNGLRVRVRCSLGCRISLTLNGSGGVTLGRLSSKLRRAGARTLHLRLGRRARASLRHFRFATLTLLMHVKSGDGEQQTVARLVRVRR